MVYNGGLQSDALQTASQPRNGKKDSGRRFLDASHDLSSDLPHSAMISRHLRWRTNIKLVAPNEKLPPETGQLRVLAVSFWILFEFGTLSLGMFKHRPALAHCVCWD